MSYPSAVATSGAAATNRPSPATGRSPAARRRSRPHSRRPTSPGRRSIPGRPPATRWPPTPLLAATLRSWDPAPMSRPGKSQPPASLSTKRSSIIASLRNVSWNLAVWPMHLPRRRAPFHFVPGQIPSPIWDEDRWSSPPGAPADGTERWPGGVRRRPGGGHRCNVQARLRLMTGDRASRWRRQWTSSDQPAVEQGKSSHRHDARPVLRQSNEKLKGAVTSASRARRAVSSAAVTGKHPASGGACRNLGPDRPESTG